MAGADLPGLIVNVQRGGPGLGGIQPSQSDYFQATKALGHGDFQMIVYAPASVQETIDMTYLAFDMADKYRTPVMILSDGLLGQMMEPVVFPTVEVQIPEKPWACCGHQNKRPHNIINSLYLQPDVLERSVNERFERYEIIKQTCAMAETDFCEDAEIVVAAFGASARVAKSAVSAARAKGIKAGLFRPQTLYPFPVEQLNKACEKAKVVLSVEMNKGQMVEDLKLALNCRLPVEFFGRHGGIIPSVKEVLAQIEQIHERIK